MALIKMGAAARRAGAGSTNAIRRALHEAGIHLVTLSPGTFAVEEDDLDRFLLNRQAVKPASSTPKVQLDAHTKQGKTKIRKVDRRRIR